MTTVVYESSALTPICRTRASFPGGKVFDPPGLEGLVAHAFYLTLRGAGERSHIELHRALEEMGARIDVQIGLDDVSFTSVCLDRHLPRVWALLSDCIAAPAMTQEEHDRLLGNDNRRYRGSDNDPRLADRRFDRYCCPDSPYARGKAGTGDETIELVRARAEVQCTVTRGGATIGFAGHIRDQPCDTLVSQLCDRLLDLPPRISPTIEEPSRLRGRRLIIVDRPDRAQSQVRIGHVVPRWGTEEFCHLRPVYVGLRQRLKHQIRERRGWAYDVRLDTRAARGPHWLCMAMSTSSQHTVEALQRCLEIYEDLCETGLSPEGLNFSSNSIVRGFPYAKDTALVRMNRRMHALALGWPEDHMDVVDEQLHHVTLEDTRRAIHRYLTPRDLCVVVVCTADELRADLEKLDWDMVTVE